MKEILLLVNRHLRIYFSSLSNIFFTLLSNLISIGVYVLFLFDNSLDSFVSALPSNQVNNASILMLLFLIAGQIMVMIISASLANLDLIIQDTQYTGSDMSVWPISKTKVMISYIIQAVIITVGFAIITLGVGLGYVYVRYSYYLPVISIIKIILLIIASSIFASLVAMLVTTFIKTSQAYVSFTTIINTLSGFLLGIYIPIGLLPVFVQRIVLVNPYFNYMYLFRNIMMGDIINTTFDGVSSVVKNQVLETFGLAFSESVQLLSLDYLPIVMSITLILVLVLTLILFKRKQIVR